MRTTHESRPGARQHAAIRRRRSAFSRRSNFYAAYANHIPERRFTHRQPGRMPRYRFCQNNDLIPRESGISAAFAADVLDHAAPSGNGASLPKARPNTVGFATPKDRRRRPPPTERLCVTIWSALPQFRRAVGRRDQSSLVLTPSRPPRRLHRAGSLVEIKKNAARAFARTSDCSVLRRCSTEADVACDQAARGAAQSRTNRERRQTPRG